MRPAYVVPFTLIAACAVPQDEATKEEEVTDTGADWVDDPPGCINIDGAGDFESIGAAAAAAPDGASIYVCGGTWVLEEDQEIVVDRSMAILGEDPATTFIEPPVNQHGFEVNAATGVTISGFTVRNATRSGVALVDAAEVTIDNMVFEEVGNWGVESSGSTGVTVSNVTFTMPQLGGVSVNDGVVAVSDSSFEQPYSFAVYAVNGAEVTLTGNTVTGTVTVAGDGSDGMAIFADAASVTTSGNVIEAPDLVGILATDSDLSLDGDVISDTAYGLFSSGGVLSISGVTITNTVYQGMYADSPTPVAIDGLSVSIEAEGSCSQAYEVWGTDAGTIWCGGAIVFADELTVSNTTISGYENYSLYVGGYTEGPAVTITDSTFQDAGRSGVQLWLEGGVADISGLTVTGIREVEAESECTGSLTTGPALFVYAGTATITGSSLVDNVGWGLASYQSAVTMDASTVSGNPCGGAIDLYGALLLSGNTFSGGAYWGTVHEELGALVAEGNTFTGTGNYTQVSTYIDETTGTVYLYEYDNSGRDIVLYEATEAEITDNAFSLGDTAIQSYSSPAVVSGNSFDTYARNIFYANGNDATDPALFSDNIITKVGGYAVYANQGFVEVENASVDENLGYTSTSRQYENGTLTYESSYDYEEPVFAAYGYSYSYVDSSTGETITYEYPGGISIEATTVGSAVSNLVTASGAQLDIDGLEAETVGTSGYGYGVYGYWDEEIAEFHLSNINIGSTASTAFYFEAGSADDGYPSLEGITVGAVLDGAGIRASGLHSLSIQDVTLESTESTGISVTGDYSELVYDEVYGYYTYVTSTRATAVVADSISIDAADSDGIDFEDGTLTLTNSVITSSSSDGLELSDATADVQGNILTGNDGYGMTCDSVTLTACSGNDLSGNVLGPHDGCDDACGL